MTQPITRKDLRAAIDAYLVTLSESEEDKDEHWVTPHRMALEVLTGFMEFTVPHANLTRIAELEAEVARLKAECANK